VLVASWRRASAFVRADLQEPFADETADEHEAAFLVELTGKVGRSKRLVRLDHELDFSLEIGRKLEMVAVEEELDHVADDGHVGDDRVAANEQRVLGEVVERA
jgi:hypothetical protein